MNKLHPEIHCINLLCIERHTLGEYKEGKKGEGCEDYSSQWVCEHKKRDFFCSQGEIKVPRKTEELLQHKCVSVLKPFLSHGLPAHHFKIVSSLYLQSKVQAQSTYSVHHWNKVHLPNGKVYANEPNLELSQRGCSSLSLSWALVARKLRTRLLNSQLPTSCVAIGSVNAKQGYECFLKIEQNLHKIPHTQWDRIKPSWYQTEKNEEKKYSQYSPPTTP